MAEVNVNWSQVREEDRLANRSRHWWEHNHLSMAYHYKTKVRQKKMFGGVAMWSLGKAAHRIIGKGQDPRGLGRWTWTKYRGKGQESLHIITAYRPITPQGEPFTVYTQQRTTLLEEQDEQCPREAFLQDLGTMVREATSEREKNLMLDANDNMAERPYTTTYGHGDYEKPFWQDTLVIDKRPSPQMSPITQLMVSGAVQGWLSLKEDIFPMKQS
jgi:hypothetical protein